MSGTCSGHNTEAPLLLISDALNSSFADTQRRARAARGARLLTAVFVRNPLTMVASMYCYHHAGQEAGLNLLFDVPKLIRLKLPEGAQAAAEMMLELVEWMGSMHHQPDTKLFRFEDLTRSSESFDAEVQGFLDFFFSGDLISPQQRSSILLGARKLDLWRNPENNWDHKVNRSHSSNQDCVREAKLALPFLEPSLLQKYHELQRRLGYPIGSA
ncbi:unnamed protein product [Effrenium voratum]|nr:unnamed protein product [Effrenium voratum]